MHIFFYMNVHLWPAFKIPHRLSMLFLGQKTCFHQMYSEIFPPPKFQISSVNFQPTIVDFFTF